MAGVGSLVWPDARLLVVMAPNPFSPAPPRISPGDREIIDRRSLAVGQWIVTVLCVRLPRLIWRWRWELAPLVALLLPAWIIGSWWAIPLGAPLAYVAGRRWCHPAARQDHAAYRALHRFVDRWPLTADHLGLSVTDHRDRLLVPTIQSVESFGGGSWRWILALPSGITAEQVERVSEQIAGAAGASSVMVERDPRRADLCSMTVVGRDDPLYGPGLSAAPVLDLPAGRSVLDPIPIGYDSTGSPVTVTLYERSILAGGSPGSGKSVSVRPILAAAALSEHCSMWLVDPKRVEFAMWRPVADRVAVGRTQAGDLLDDLVAEMERRYEWLERRGEVKITPSAEWPLIVLAVDELADLTASGVDKEGKARAAHFAEQLRRLVALGRASSVFCLLSTQKPSSDVVPSSIRDLIAIRIGLRCGSEAQAITIMGEEAVRELGAACNAIPASSPGLGYLFGEEGAKVHRFRSYFLDGDDLRGLIERAAAWRGSLTPPPSVPAVDPAPSSSDGSTTCAEHRDNPADGKDCPACLAIWNEHKAAEFRAAWGGDAA